MPDRLRRRRPGKSRASCRRTPAAQAALAGESALGVGLPECRPFGKCRHAGSRPGTVAASPGTGRYFSISSPDLGLARELLFPVPVGTTYVWRRHRPRKFDNVRKSMIKIQVKELDDQLILQVEGRLAGAFVPELEDCWQRARANQPNRKISVDLKSVTCVDRAGRYLLQLMHSNGVGFLRAGLAIQDVLDRAMEQPECNVGHSLQPRDT